jgi:hypothetical protein
MTTRIVRVGNMIPLTSSSSGEHKHIRAGLAELEAGRSVSNERVAEWLDSWARKTSCLLRNEDLLVSHSGNRPEINPLFHRQGQPWPESF